METGVKIEGLNAMVRDLRELGLEIADLKDAFGQVARLASGKAQDFAPLGPKGWLKASIKPVQRQNYAGVRAGSPKRVPYAAAVNYGTGRRPGKRGPHNIQARQFMQKADLAVRPLVVPILTQEINRKIAEKRLG